MTAMLAAMLLSGCGTGSTGRSVPESSAPVAQSTSAAAFSAPQNVSEVSHSAEILYFGSKDVSGVSELFEKNSGCAVTVESAGGYDYINKLSERISADNSPDLCDKLDNTFPYLVSLNLYENLTNYIDVTSPQWSEITDTIELYSFLGGHYFYPTSVKIMPQFLMYDKWSFVQNENLPDPEKQWLSGEWTWSAMAQSGAEIIEEEQEQILISGEHIFDNFMAATGSPIYPRSELTEEELLDGQTTRSFFPWFDLPQSESAVSFLSEYPISSGVIDSGAVNKLRSSVFLAGDEKLLAELRKNDITVGIVPFPRFDGEDSDGVYYYKAATEGFLVPKGSKNIQSAASFINYSRIREISEENRDRENRKLVLSGLLRSDVEWLESLRGSSKAKTVLVDTDCFDDATNFAAREIMAFDSAEDYRKKLEEYRSVIDLGINQIEQLI